jgi:hypothetical protein
MEAADTKYEEFSVRIRADVVQDLDMQRESAKADRSPVIEHALDLFLLDRSNRAFHEAGHAVINRTHGSQIKSLFVPFSPTHGSFVLSDNPLLEYPTPWDKSVFQKVVDRTVAGDVARAIRCKEQSLEWGDGTNDDRALAKEYAIGLCRQDPSWREIDEVIDRRKNAVKEYLGQEQVWAVLDQLVRDLIRKGSIDPADAARTIDAAIKNAAPITPE